MKSFGKILSVFLALSMVISVYSVPVYADESWPSDVDIESPSAIVMDISTGTVLYEKNADEQLYPASITKIMTALLAVENNDMDEEVTFSYEAVYETEGSSIARDVGEVMTLEECLYGMMLESANECAYAIAEHVGGDYDTFIEMMNEKAEELGCTNTHFNNPNGLPDEDHYVSARDMAIIARAAYQNETFRIICGTKTYQIPPTNKHDEITYLRNHHNMLYPLTTTKYLYDYCTGGKTGYTTVANSTLVTYAEKDDMELVCVVMNTTSPNHYLDTTELFEYCFNNFKTWNIVENDELYSENQETFFTSDASVFSSSDSMIIIDETAEIILPVNVDFSAAQSTVEYSEDGNIGTIVYTYGDKQVGSAEISLSDLSEISFSYPSDTAAGSEVDKPIIINIAKIFLFMILASVIVVVIAALIYLKRNYYIIRHKMRSKRRKW
ncbi:MAG: D-alanyl-D-alanine carboxypeptidase [Eubacterium sp.]|nr:D-alanyl-D-alanine carboxypeptidase [Eubacterium sp.]